MKRIALIIALVFALFETGGASSYLPHRRGGFQGGAPSVSYTVKQDFEGAGYDNSETWTEAGTGTKNEDYTATVLVGTESLNLAFVGQNGTTSITLAADQGSAWVYFQVHFLVLPATGKIFFRLTDSAAANPLTVENLTGNLLRMRVGSSVVTLVDAITTGVTYHVWVKYIKGTGSDAQGELAVSTDGTKPTSGNWFTSTSSGTSTTDVNKLFFGTANTSTWDAIFDKIRCDDVAIGDNPE